MRLPGSPSKWFRIEGSNPVLKLQRLACYQLHQSGMVGVLGIEPSLFLVKSQAHHRLCVTPVVVWMRGFEPPASRSQAERSDQAELHPVGAPGRIRTDDLPLTRRSLSPTELQGLGLTCPCLVVPLPLGYLASHPRQQQGDDRPRRAVANAQAGSLALPKSPFRSFFLHS